MTSEHTKQIQYDPFLNKEVLFILEIREETYVYKGKQITISVPLWCSTKSEYCVEDESFGDVVEHVIKEFKKIENSS